MARSVKLSTASDIMDLADFVQLMAMNGRTGRLRISSRSKCRELVLASGAIVDFSDPNAPETADEAEDNAARQHAVVEGFVDILDWPDPELEFTELSTGDIAEYVGEGNPDALSVQGTLLEVHQTRDLIARTSEVIQNLDTILVVEQSRRDSYTGSPYERILEMLDGRKTVRSVINAFGMEKYQALERLATLAKKQVAVPIDPLQLEMLAWDYESRNDNAGALACYRQLRHQTPDNTRILKNISGVLAHLGRREEAAQALGEYARTCVEDDVLDDAVRAYALALTFDPDNIPLREDYIEVLASRGKDPKLLDEYTALADRYVAADDPMLAKNVLRRALKLAPDHVGARRRLADLCRRVGETSGAVIELMHLVTLYRERGDLDEALATAMEALEFDAGCIEARVLLTGMLLDRGESVKALAEIRALESTMRSIGKIPEGELPEPVRELYESLAALDPSCREAVEAVGETAERDGDDAKATEMDGRLVSIHAESGDLAAAIAVLERMIRRLPEAFELHAQLADLYVRTDESLRAVAIYEFAGEGMLGSGRFAEAARIFGSLLEIEPTSMDAALGFARALRGRGDHHRAMLRFRQAARMLEDESMYDEELGALEEALDCEPGDPESALRAGSIHEKRGHRRRAIHLYTGSMKLAAERGDESAVRRFRERILYLEPGNAVALGRDPE
jgi:tetratricopeptide (TPR) repeat protein